MAAVCCHVVKGVVKCGRVLRLVGSCHRDQVSLDMREGIRAAFFRVAAWYQRDRCLLYART
jgi:hypothetical protein